MLSGRIDHPGIFASKSKFLDFREIWTSTSDYIHCWMMTVHWERYTLLTWTSEDERRSCYENNPSKANESRKSVDLVPSFFQEDVGEQSGEDGRCWDANCSIAERELRESTVNTGNGSEVDSSEANQKNPSFSLTQQIGFGPYCWRQHQKNLGY